MEGGHDRRIRTLVKKKNNTWSFVVYKLGKKVLGCKWVFTIMHKANGQLKGSRKD